LNDEPSHNLILNYPRWFEKKNDKTNPSSVERLKQRCDATFSSCCRQQKYVFSNPFILCLDGIWLLLFVVLKATLFLRYGQQQDRKIQLDILGYPKSKAIKIS
jgi:hypothetical protein